MTALSSSRRIREERAAYKQFPLAAVSVFQGGAACIDTATGYVTKAAANTALKVIGLFAENVDNSGGSAGDLSANVKLAKEVVGYRFVNGATSDAIVSADIGKFCYFLDDQTVSILPGSNAVAGVVLDVDAALGVLVELVGPEGSGDLDSAHEESLTAGADLEFTTNACAIATPGRNVHRKVPTTGAASSISLGTTGAVRGDMVVFTADGSANGHTVTYKDGSTAISAAATASKRHTAICFFDGAAWTCALSVGP